MFFIISYLTLAFVSAMNCAVLDPALYLSPSPPMKLSSSAESLWYQSPHSTVESRSENILALNIDKEATFTKARTFWPKIRPDYRLGSIHIPLTFTLSGSYGNNGADSITAIGTNYASVSGLGNTKISASNSKPSLSTYDQYNSGPTVLRIYGGNNKPSWSGWGNGKWGHYGKG